MDRYSCSVKADLWLTLVRSVFIPGKVKVSLPGHGDVGEVLLEDEDVPAHLLDTRLADPLKVLSPVDENAGDQMAQT